MVVKNEKTKHIIIEIGSLGLVTPIGTIIGIVLTINYGEDAAGKMSCLSDLILFSTFILTYQVV